MTFGATKNKFQIKWTIHLHILSIEKKWTQNEKANECGEKFILFNPFYSLNFSTI